MKKLPIGIQNRREIGEEEYFYVGKAPFEKQFAEGDKYCFLSRPRPVGKSLFLGTMKEAFSNNKRLFTGLYLEENEDWKKKYSVL